MIPAIAPPSGPAPSAMDRRRKAAIVVQSLLSDGQRPPLASLPEDTQVRLARELGSMDLVDRATLNAVLAEFADHLEAVGLGSPGGVDAALASLSGHISPTASARLKAEASGLTGADPWLAVAALAPRALVGVLEAESVEVGAVVLSKLPVARAAEALALLPGERARQITYAVSRTSGIASEAVRRIGQAIAADYCSQPPQAFALPAGERVGAILNSSVQAMRDGLLDGLEAEDSGFAAEVRRAIFTFAHLPGRLGAGDVPRVLRVLDPKVIAAALVSARASGGEEEAAADFILASVSQRMADSLREEAETLGNVRRADGESAQAAVIAAIRERVALGEVVLIEAEEAED